MFTVILVFSLLAVFGLIYWAFRSKKTEPMSDDARESWLEAMQSTAHHYDSLPTKPNSVAPAAAFSAKKSSSSSRSSSRLGSSSSSSSSSYSPSSYTPSSYDSGGSSGGGYSGGDSGGGGSSSDW